MQSRFTTVQCGPGHRRSWRHAEPAQDEGQRQEPPKTRTPTWPSPERARSRPGGAADTGVLRSTPIATLKLNEIAPINWRSFPPRTASMTMQYTPTNTWTGGAPNTAPHTPVEHGTANVKIDTTAPTPMPLHAAHAGRQGDPVGHHLRRPGQHALRQHRAAGPVSRSSATRPGGPDPHHADAEHRRGRPALDHRQSHRHQLHALFGGRSRRHQLRPDDLCQRRPNCASPSTP